jgi:hypothetical protein
VVVVEGHSVVELLAQVALVLAAMEAQVLRRVLRHLQQIVALVVEAVVIRLLITEQVALEAPALSSSSTTSHHRLYSPLSHRLVGLAQQV